MTDFSSKKVKEVALVTGGSLGIGKGCVERLVKDGYKVRGGNNIT